MVGYRVAWAADLYLLLRNGAVRGAVVAAALIPAVRIGWGEVEGSLELARRGALLPTGDGGRALNAFGPLVDGVAAGLVAVAFLVVAAGASIFARDREHGVVRLYLTRRVSRAALVLAKLSHMVLLSLVLVGVVLLSSVAGAALVGDFGPVVDSGYEIYALGEIREEVALGILAALPAVLATAALGLLASLCSSSTARALGAGIGALLAFEALEVLSGGGWWLFSFHQPGIVDGSYLREVSWKVAYGFSDIMYTDRELLWSFVVPLAQGVFFAGVGLFVAERRSM